MRRDEYASFVRKTGSICAVSEWSALYYYLLHGFRAICEELRLAVTREYWTLLRGEADDAGELAFYHAGLNQDPRRHSSSRLKK